MNHAAKRGFTIIELMLAMSFISVLLLAVAMTVIQIGVTYNRGMALKDVNQSARDIGADVRRNLSSAESIAVDTDYITTPAGGRLCLGSYSYIWNTGKALGDNSTNVAWYGNDSDHVRQIRFVKIPDSAKIYCATNAAGVLTYRDIRTTDVPQAQELLQRGDHQLNIHKFELSTSDTARDETTGQQLYTLDYIIGAGDVSAMNTTQSACLPASDPNADIAYCNVQQFSLVIRAGNRV